MDKPRNVNPTMMQKRGVDNLLSGKYNKIKPALIDAGFSNRTVANPRENFFKAKGVEVYLKTLSKVAKKRWSMSLGDKVAMTYLDGLEATKLFGKDAIEHPDFMARKAFADSFAKFFGWSHEQLTPGSKFQQFNFFSTAENEKRNFNDSFRVFLKQL